MATGKASIVVHTMAFLSQESVWAAEAAHCAAEQGAFRPYHDHLFLALLQRRAEVFTGQGLKELATALGLDAAAFGQCLDSGRYQQQVLAQTEAGFAAGVRGTPTVFINQRRIDGLQQTEVYRTAIEEELAAP